MDISTLALGTRGGLGGAIRDLPRVLAITALKLSLVDHFNLSTCNLERLGFDQGFGNFPVRRFNNPPEGLAGNTHTLGRLLLVKPFPIGEANSFKLVQGHGDDLQRIERNTLRLEEGAGGLGPYPSATEWSRHRRNAPSHKMIMSICSQCVKRFLCRQVQRKRMHRCYPLRAAAGTLLGQTVDSSGNPEFNNPWRRSEGSLSFGNAGALGWHSE
jgi:hypothetical protein